MEQELKELLEEEKWAQADIMKQQDGTSHAHTEAAKGLAVMIDMLDQDTKRQIDLIRANAELKRAEAEKAKAEAEIAKAKESSKGEIIKASAIVGGALITGIAFIVVEEMHGKNNMALANLEHEGGQFVGTILKNEIRKGPMSPRFR